MFLSVNKTSFHIGISLHNVTARHSSNASSKLKKCKFTISPIYKCFVFFLIIFNLKKLTSV